jgi:hypothetical protein
VAFNTLAGTAYVPLDLSAVTNLPTAVEFDISAPDPDADTGKPASKTSTK